MLKYATKETNKQGIEKIKPAHTPCDLIKLPPSYVKDNLHMLSMLSNVAYVRIDDALLFFDKKNNSYEDLELAGFEIEQFDRALNPTSRLRTLTLKETKKLNYLVSHTADVLCIELLYSGTGVQTIKTTFFEKLLSEISFSREFHDVFGRPGWFYSDVNKTVQISVPINHVEVKSDDYLKLKNFIEKWDNAWFSTLEYFEKEIIKEKNFYHSLIKNDWHIPLLSQMIFDSHLLVTFLYSGKGMNPDKTGKINVLLKNSMFTHKEYALSDGGTAVELIIPFSEIVEQTMAFQSLRKFIVVHDEDAYEDFNRYEMQITCNTQYDRVVTPQTKTK